MKWFLVLSLLITTKGFAVNYINQGGEPYYTAINSTEAQVQFEHWVEINSYRQPVKWLVFNQIEQQLAHLFGPLGAAEFAAVPKTDHRFEIGRTEKINNQTFRVHYSYTGTFAVRMNRAKTIDLIIPNNPDQIFSAGVVGKTNPCTDSHYQSEGDFWYFWNPYQEGCPLKEGIDYEIVTASMVRLPNVKRSFPEYERLADQDQILRMSLFFGMDKPTKSPDPRTSKDINALNYRRTARDLKKLGFEVTEQKNNQTYFLEIYEKNYAGDFGIKNIRLTVYFGPTGISEQSGQFHKFLKNTLENEAIMIYDGHSGLGGHLDLESIEISLGQKIKFPLEKYQILFFNSCSSYPYYNTQYFARKMTQTDERGSKNMEIMTNGLATYFHTISNSNMAVLFVLDSYAANGVRTSYQEIAKAIDSDNLFGINGDEDNPKN
ncbi:MAG: hypothetical protein ACLGGX_03450 [Bdellovibrionia bacterium]